MRMPMGKRQSLIFINRYFLLPPNHLVIKRRKGKGKGIFLNFPAAKYMSMTLYN
jgi:hypothetical protein